ncbi:MAG: IS3 family transposase, partial [Geobacteraceae bacterium]|nr:IS3 family transposase [Geobacteraceae bacterium]
GPNLSRRAPGHKIYPYLLRNVPIVRVNQVWSVDITYIRLKGGFVYLVAIIDWFSRYVIDFGISITLEADFCIETLERALLRGKPEIFNSDQGSQFTSPRHTQILETAGILISMDGKGRAIDNVFIERLWRSVKHEHIFHNSPADGLELYQGLKSWFNDYNTERRHRSLDGEFPITAYITEKKKQQGAIN